MKKKFNVYCTLLLLAFAICQFADPTSGFRDFVRGFNEGFESAGSETDSPDSEEMSIFLESNAQCINIIYNALTLACSETEETSFLDIISGENFNANIYLNSDELNSEAADIINTHKLFSFNAQNAAGAAVVFQRHLVDGKSVCKEMGKSVRMGAEVAPRRDQAHVPQITGVHIQHAVDLRRLIGVINGRVLQSAADIKNLHVVFSFRTKKGSE